MFSLSVGEGKQSLFTLIWKKKPKKEKNKKKKKEKNKKNKKTK